MAPPIRQPCKCVNWRVCVGRKGGTLLLRLWQASFYYDFLLAQATLAGTNYATQQHDQNLGCTRFPRAKDTKAVHDVNVIRTCWFYQREWQRKCRAQKQL